MSRTEKADGDIHVAFTIPGGPIDGRGLMSLIIEASDFFRDICTETLRAMEIQNHEVGELLLVQATGAIVGAMDALMKKVANDLRIGKLWPPGGRSGTAS